MNERQYLLKIVLLDIEPDIWRRFVVPGSITLDRLHDVIQIIMGWTDSHLHEFTIGKKRYTEYPESEEFGLECGRYHLGDLIKQNGRTFNYLYDFGDSWMHKVTLEDSRYFNPKLRSPIKCLEGARACPPEDVGSIPGYYEFCKALKDPDHPEHEDYKIWASGFYGHDGEFDSEAFDIERVTYELYKYLRWSRDRYHYWGVSSE